MTQIMTNYSIVLTLQLFNTNLLSHRHLFLLCLFVIKLILEVHVVFLGLQYFLQGFGAFCRFISSIFPGDVVVSAVVHSARPLLIHLGDSFA